MSSSHPQLDLASDVKYVAGVGPARAKLLDRLDIRVVDDLLWHIPVDILDLTHVVGPEQLADGEFATVQGHVVDIDAKRTGRGGALSSVLLLCRAGGGRSPGYVRALWFNQPWQLNKFRGFIGTDQDILLSGKPKYHNGRWEFSHPQVQVLPQNDDHDEDIDEESVGESEPESEEAADRASDRLLPKYRLTEGVSQWQMRRVCRNAAEQAAQLLADPLPQQFRERNNVVPLGAAVLGLHAPSVRADFDDGLRRVHYDDLLGFQCGLAMRRRAWKRGPTASEIEISAKVDARIRRLFPFRCTEGQEAAIQDIVADLAKPHPMHRLLQADVGAGKTTVAIYAMLAAIAAGYQAVLMAPTEILATQHAATVESLLSHSRVRRQVLTGRLTAAQRREALAEIASGEAQLIVGTQAVIQDAVEFANLGLVVIDEQHKFGVAQRAHFSRSLANSGNPPHVLVMTATPIPRSLCLTQFGDLDLTVVRDRPPGRQPITTARVLTRTQRRKMWDFVRRKLDQGRQLYVVSPRVDGDDDVPGAERLFAELREHELSEYRVGLVHGRMDRQERDDVMEEFRVGSLHALIATTVIEVGVDVPNATLMIIERADLFGLSQLHQLRGRIGRGTHRSYCFLRADGETDAATTNAAARLAVMEETDDGFAIAERDFEIRGAGDVLGTRQSGQSALRFADIARDSGLLAETRKAAFQLVESGEIDEPIFAAWKREVLDRFGELMELPRSG